MYHILSTLIIHHIHSFSYILNEMTGKSTLILFFPQIIDHTFKLRREPFIAVV